MEFQGFSDSVDIFSEKIVNENTMEAQAAFFGFDPTVDDSGLEALEPESLEEESYEEPRMEYPPGLRKDSAGGVIEAATEERSVTDFDSFSIRERSAAKRNDPRNDEMWLRNGGMSAHETRDEKSILSQLLGRTSQREAPRSSSMPAGGSSHFIENGELEVSELQAETKDGKGLYMERYRMLKRYVEDLMITMEVTIPEEIKGSHPKRDEVESRVSSFITQKNNEFGRIQILLDEAATVIASGYGAVEVDEKLHRVEKICKNLENSKTYLTKFLSYQIPRAGHAPVREREHEGTQNQYYASEGGYEGRGRGGGRYDYRQSKRPGEYNREYNRGQVTTYGPKAAMGYSSGPHTYQSLSAQGRGGGYNAVQERDEYSRGNRYTDRPAAMQQPGRYGYQGRFRQGRPASSEYRKMDEVVVPTKVKKRMMKEGELPLDGDRQKPDSRSGVVRKSVMTMMERNAMIRMQLHALEKLKSPADTLYVNSLKKKGIMKESSLLSESGTAQYYRFKKKEDAPETNGTRDGKVEEIEEKVQEKEPQPATLGKEVRNPTNAPKPMIEVEKSIARREGPQKETEGGEAGTKSAISISMAIESAYDHFLRMKDEKSDNHGGLGPEEVKKVFKFFSIRARGVKIVPVEEVEYLLFKEDEAFVKLMQYPKAQRLLAGIIPYLSSDQFVDLALVYLRNIVVIMQICGGNPAMEELVTDILKRLLMLDVGNVNSLLGNLLDSIFWPEQPKPSGECIANIFQDVVGSMIMQIVFRRNLEYLQMKGEGASMKMAARLVERLEGNLRNMFFRVDGSCAPYENVKHIFNSLLLLLYVTDKEYSKPLLRELDTILDVYGQYEYPKLIRDFPGTNV